MTLNIESYNLFLFDFDGLLVDTEKLHYQAYGRALKRFGCDFSWSFQEYASRSLTSSDGIKRDLLAAFPQLVDWNALYQEKARCYVEILHESPVELMPGAADLLKRVHQLGKTSCVVTHSTSAYTQLIREKRPELANITHWITREDYSNPKPAPDCYQIAIDKYSDKGPVIGFEDSPKGLRALLSCQVTSVLVNAHDLPETPSLTTQGAHYFRSLRDLTST